MLASDSYEPSVGGFVSFRFGLGWEGREKALGGEKEGRFLLRCHRSVSSQFRENNINGLLGNSIWLGRNRMCGWGVDGPPTDGRRQKADRDDLAAACLQRPNINQVT